jgi:hypothetical protein
LGIAVIFKSHIKNANTKPFLLKRSGNMQKGKWNLRVLCLELSRENKQNILLDAA